MKELTEALKFIQNKLQGHDRVIITPEGFEIQLVSPENRESVESNHLDAEEISFVINSLQTEEESQQWMENYYPYGAITEGDKKLLNKIKEKE
tara:strand:- start:276 stop:554 length:279 start_codon:yes stop_codon:yes gene_type:complete